MVHRIFIPLREFSHPGHYGVIGFIHVLFAFLVSWLIFPNNIGVMTVLLTVVFGAPFMYILFMRENTLLPHFKDKDLAEFAKIILTFFVGQVAAFSLLYLALPSQVAQEVFVQTIFAPYVMDFITQTSNQQVGLIIADNLRYLLIAILLSVMYGAGAVFMLTIASLYLAVIIVELVTIAPTFAFGGVILLLLQVLGYVGVGASIALFIQTAKTHPKTKVFMKISKLTSKVFFNSLLLLLLAVIYQIVLVKG